MIKRIKSNGIYWLVVSFLLATIACGIQTIKSNLTIHLYYLITLLLLLICVVIMVRTDYIMLKKRKIIYISRIQILLTLPLFLILFFNVNIIEITIIISFIHCIYRSFHYRIIEKLKIDLKYKGIIKLLNLTNEFIEIKGTFKNYVICVRDKDIYFNDDFSLFFKNKKVRFAIIKELEIEFNKPFLSFNDDELQVAEMYSIQ